MVGFKPQPALGDEQVGQFLVSISGSYDMNRVYVYDSYAGSWTKATGGTWLVPGQAMWIDVIAAAGTTLTP